MFALSSVTSVRFCWFIVLLRSFTYGLPVVLTPEDSYAGGLVSSVVMLRGGGTFEKWVLVGDY